MENTIRRQIIDANPKIILTLETCIKGGSISIFRGKKLLDFYIGNRNISGSEDLLPKISELLIKNNIPKSKIDTIAVSNGPGSFTGIRIGIATALALQKSLNCNCYGFDMLKALAVKGSFQTKSERIVSTISQGRNKICWFDFDVKNLDSTDSNDYVVSELDFFIKYLIENSQSEEVIAVYADSYIYDSLAGENKPEFGDKINLINAGENLSAILGFALSIKNADFEKPKPLYINETNFGA